jgi:hypothetical protein
MDVVNQYSLLLFAKTFTGEGIAAAEKAPQRPQKHVARESVSKPVARLLHPLQSSAYGQLASSQSLSLTVGFMFLFQMIQSISLVQRRSIDVTVHQLRFQSDQCIHSSYTSQLSAIISPCCIDRSTHGARIWGTQAFQLSFLVPPNKPVEGKAPSDRRRRRMRTTTQRR